MDTQEELLSFLDLLDLDESMIDAPLKYLMGRTSYTNRHLKNAIMLLQYKMLINTQEGTECENEDEFDFVVKLMREMGEDNIEYVCKIVNLVLTLCPSEMVSKAEHLLQQLLPEIEFRTATPNTSLAEQQAYKKKLLVLKASDSILDAVMKRGEQISLMFLETPLERILDCQDEKLKVYFFTKTVPKLMEGVIGYSILDRIWLYMQYLKGERKEIALGVLSCLSDYYLPSPDEKGDSVYATELIFQYNFWDILLFGLNSDDAATRKISVYLTKRAIDCVVAAKRDFSVRSRQYDIIFEWKHLNSKPLRNMWDNYFVLLDSLEEKQSNIVLPSLKLFESIAIGDCWLNCAFKLGLKHDNTQVRIKCIEYKLKTKLKSQAEARILLEALNDINIYDRNTNYEAIKALVMELLKDRGSFIEISKTIPLVKWSPIPLYHLTSVLADLNIDMPAKYGNNDICTIIIDIIKIVCNNTIISKAVQINILNFVKYCCKNLNWRDVIRIYSHLNTGIVLKDMNEEHPLVSIVKQVLIADEDKIAHLKLLADNYKDIDLIILFLSNNEDHVSLFIDVINEKINKLQETVNRQYCDKKENLNDVIFLIHFQSKAQDNNSLLHDINEVIARENKTILQYILGLFSNETNLTLEEAVALFKKDDIRLNEDLVGILLELYKTAVLVLKDNPEIDKAVLSIFSIKMLLKNHLLKESYKHEMLNMKQFIEMVMNLNLRDALSESVGRSKNAIYEKSCEIVFWYLKEGEDIETCLQETIDFIEIDLECGGYNCLEWILKIVNFLIEPLINDKTNFNMTKFIIRAWNEIEELKSNNQYSPCIEEFVKLITQDALLEKSMYNNIIILYCNRIIEYGPVKTNPLYYLTKSLNNKDLKNYGHLIYVLCEILLYSPVPRKDQRITDNVVLEIIQNPKYGINRESVETHFNYEIQYIAIRTLFKMNDIETLRMITNFITIRIDNTFKNKQRYHGNSQMHRILQTTLQHILVLVLKNGDLEHLLHWCLDLMVKLPHQPSIRICIEWFVALYFYIQKINIGDQVLDVLKSKNVPLTSQFYITYWLLKHKISNNTYIDDEYSYVFDFLLSHTMGQLFNVRLNAQFLAMTLYKLAKKQTKYEYTIDVIQKTFAECNNDKNFVKLTCDYFTNEFDIVANLNPYFIYHVLPRYCEIDNNEKVDVDFIKSIMKDVNENLSKDSTKDFVNEWKSCRKADDDFVELERNKDVYKVLEDPEAMGTIQKKYIPWRNMSDVNVYDVGKKRQSSSELIVVASLIDKLPNLGGMARTSEVFGVQTLVVDSLRHLQDKQFQGLSVSAERWINVEEVRPGRPLKEYLLKKKEEGYTIVAAEQTSTSVKLQTFKFPKKSLLLLGHEKEGVPCDLLPIMDYCVEIPQQGYVRSLNVHVTAAIFVWEYARQNVV